MGDYERKKIYFRTKKGLVVNIARTQVKNSKVRGMDRPTYSRVELQDWLYSQTLFHELYDKWKASGYEKNLRPSVNRLNDYLGYSMSNIEIMTWEENRQKYIKDVTTGVNNKVNRSVSQYTKEGELVDTYHSARFAERELGYGGDSIGKVCRGVRDSLEGFIWKYNN